MRLRGSVAIDLGTVNTLVWVAGRGIVLEEPTAIAIDRPSGRSRRSARRRTRWPTRSRRTSR
jgi:actin-like ATPase involved in cell morphogenesis